MLLQAAPQSLASLCWSIRRIAPDLDPKAQPNTGVVQLVATFTLSQVPLTGQAINEVTRVATVDEVSGPQIAEPEPPTLDGIQQN